MRSWKLALLVLFLVAEGILITNWVYNVRAQAPNNHICAYITCQKVIGYTCAGATACTNTNGTAQF